MSCFSISMPLKRLSLCLLLLAMSLNLFTLSTEARPHREAKRHLIEVDVKSLHPKEDLPCKHTPSRKGASLEVVHRHGSCSNLKPNSTHHGSLPSFDLSMQLDQQRVDSIHPRLSRQSLSGEKVKLDGTSSVNLPPPRSGNSLGTGNYIVTVGLGTPQKDLSLVFDTGSDLTWTQCKPCSLGSCYSQVDPMFDPSSSSSYSNIACDSYLCDDLGPSTGAQKAGCSASTGSCVYNASYNDKSYSTGYLARERLTLTSSEIFDGFVFGCGEDNNQGVGKGFAGLIGLDRSWLSLTSQAADAYGNYFSYCLPSSSSSTGHLTLGQGAYTPTSSSYTYTPLLTNSDNPTFYFVELQSISVNGKQLPISPDVFSSDGTIIDSGTVISRLPEEAYSALRDAFKQTMSQYPSVPAMGVFDTCYDFSNNRKYLVPEVALSFGGGLVLNLPVTGIMYSVGNSQACLAFAANTGSGFGILGNAQQLGFDVVYDVGGAQIGFGPNAC